jgi:transcriptional regulator with XRE-family HTH domain
MSKQTTSESEELGERIKHIRTLLNKSQKEISDDIQYSQSNLSQVENGVNEPGSSLLRRLSQKYPQINIDWIITGTGNPIKGEKDKSTGELNEELRAQNRLLNKRITFLEMENMKLIDILQKKMKK